MKVALTAGECCVAFLRRSVFLEIKKLYLPDEAKSKYLSSQEIIKALAKVAAERRV